MWPDPQQNCLFSLLSSSGKFLKNVFIFDCYKALRLEALSKNVK